MSLRPPRDEDFDAVLELMRASQLASFGEADATAEELRRWLTTPYVVVERDLRVLDRGGRLVGYADADLAESTGLWWCDVHVDPREDAEEVLVPLLTWLDERAQSGTLRVWTSVTDARMLDAFARAGFAESRHSYRMELSLGAEARQPDWPGGITVRTLASGEERLAYDLVAEVWQDASDPMDETFEEWQHWTTKTDAFDPSLWFLAHDGDQPAGFSFCKRDDNDPSAGYVSTLGVRRPWRRRGLGEALLLHSFAAFRERGWTRATLGVDASSPTGATRLYERAGMSVYRDTVFLERPVRRS